MLEPKQVYNGPHGDSLEILYRLPNAIGEVFSAARSFGPLCDTVQVTEQGLVEGGYGLQEPEAPVETETVDPVAPDPDWVDPVPTV